MRQDTFTLAVPGAWSFIYPPKTKRELPRIYYFVCYARCACSQATPELFFCLLPTSGVPGAWIILISYVLTLPATLCQCPCPCSIVHKLHTAAVLWALFLYTHLRTPKYRQIQ
uniref:Uncharacterized protein n=1 Tax=Cacopsylla melanoneura TaxID=428564 RepID=A0A8D8QBS5_9HEMI